MLSNQGVRKKENASSIAEKRSMPFLYQDWIFWPNVTNIPNDDFMPHHFVFYVFFDLLSEKIQKWPKTGFFSKTQFLDIFGYLHFSNQKISFW